MHLHRERGFNAEKIKYIYRVQILTMRWMYIVFIFVVIHSTSAADPSALTAEQFCSDGDQMYARGDFEKALWSYENAIIKDKNFAKAWFGKGYALCALCKENEAKESWENAKRFGYEDVLFIPQECCISRPTVSNNFSASKSITWNFEVGILRGWNATGKAFEEQPHGELTEDKLSGLQGKYWICTDDGATGNLTSRPFRILGERMDFLIGGSKDCSVSLVVGDVPVMTTCGSGTNVVERVTWNISAYKRKIASLMLSDGSSSPEGRLYFDDVRFDIAPRLIESTMI